MYLQMMLEDSEELIEENNRKTDTRETKKRTEDIVSWDTGENKHNNNNREPL